MQTIPSRFSNWSNFDYDMTFHKSQNNLYFKFLLQIWAIRDSARWDIIMNNNNNNNKCFLTQYLYIFETLRHYTDFVKV